MLFQIKKNECKHRVKCDSNVCNDQKYMQLLLIQSLIRFQTY